MKRIAIVLALSFVAVPALAAPPAKPAAPAPNAKQACIASHEEALKLKGDKKPHAAQEKFVVCARAECPVVVRKECSEQLEQVQAAAPSIALAALDDKGNSDILVRVTLDGQVVAEKLTGTAFDVEPGEHTIVFERERDGKRIEQRLLIVEGEKNRKVLADYQLLVPKPPPPPVAAPAKKVPVLAFVAGGVAALALGSFAFFSISGKGKEDDLAGTCAPSCAGKDVSPVKRDYVIADVSLGIGIFALAAAVVMALPALTSGSGKSAAALGPAPWMPRLKVVR